MCFWLCDAYRHSAGTKSNQIKPTKSLLRRSPCQTRSQRIHTGKVKKKMNWQSEHAQNLNSPGAKEQN